MRGTSVPQFPQTRSMGVIWWASSPPDDSSRGISPLTPRPSYPRCRCDSVQGIDARVRSLFSKNKQERYVCVIASCSLHQVHCPMTVVSAPFFPPRQLCIISSHAIHSFLPRAIFLALLHHHSVTSDDFHKDLLANLRVAQPYRQANLPSSFQEDLIF